MAVLVISYSRADQAQVRAVVALLRAAMRDLEQAVYWDGDFDPGDPWFDQLKGYIDNAPQLFVFWCEHSARSAQVRREFAYALEKKKRVIPVLLDGTPLTDELAPIHGIDLRGAVTHVADLREAPVPSDSFPPAAAKRSAPRAAAPPRWRWSLWTAMAVGTVALVGVQVAPRMLRELWERMGQLVATNVGGGEGGAIGGGGSLPSPEGSNLIILLIFALLFLALIAGMGLLVAFVMRLGVRRYSWWQRKRRIVRAFAEHLR